MIERAKSGSAGAWARALFADAKVTVDGAEARLEVGASAEQVEAIADLAVTLAHGP
jgi:hypothetical protein